MKIYSDYIIRLTAALTAALLLFLALWLHLIVPLFAGLLVYHLVHALTPLLKKRVADERARMIVAALLAALLVALLTLSAIGIISFLRSEEGQPEAILGKAMAIVEEARTQLPAWVSSYLPENAEKMRNDFTEWLHGHAREVQLVGKEAGRFFVHIIIGLILGGIIAVSGVRITHEMKPFAAALTGYSRRFADSFRNIVFAQIKISLINTIFTAIFLLGILPIAGVKLPLTKTLVLITFLAGLLPVIGNLISNTLITIVALSMSIYVAIASLTFLVVIHKLEYFLNARIVGSQINARTWELLVAMLAFESAFGIPGLVAAPLYYAYIKAELQRIGWV